MSHGAHARAVGANTDPPGHCFLGILWPVRQRQGPNLTKLKCYRPTGQADMDARQMDNLSSPGQLRRVLPNPLRRRTLASLGSVLHLAVLPGANVSWADSRRTSMLRPLFPQRRIWPRTFALAHSAWSNTGFALALAA